MSRVRVRGRIVTIVKIQTVSLRLKSEALVQQHGWVVDGNVESNVFPSAGLNEMVQHHFPYSSSREVRMNEEKRDIGFSDLHIRSHKGTPDYHLPVQSNTSKVRMTQ